MIYSIIVLYELGPSKILAGSYYLNVGTEEENKTIGNKGVTTGHFKGKEK